MKNKNPGHYNEPFKQFDVICVNKECEAEWTIESEKDVFPTFDKKGKFEAICQTCRFPMKIDSFLLSPGLKEKLESKRKYEDRWGEK